MAQEVRIRPGLLTILRIRIAEKFARGNLKRYTVLNSSNGKNSTFPV